MSRAVVLVVCVACGAGGARGPLRARGPDRSAAPAVGRGPVFTVLGDEDPTTVDLRGEHEAYQYVVQRELSGVAADLHAVCIDRTRAYVAGDGGVVLRRAASGGWLREQTPTTRRIRALVVARDEGGADAWTDSPADVPLYAVGDAGTVLRRSREGVWAVEPTPTEDDLHDVVELDKHLFAVGDHGTLIERRDGSWRSIPTNTAADLRYFDGGLALGLGGVVVDCLAWDREQRDLARWLACVPRPSPTGEDLATRVDDRDVFGTNGVRLRTTVDRPIVLEPGDALPGRPAITAGAANRWYVNVGQLAQILVGRAGVIVFLGLGAPSSITLAGTPDLFDVASDQLDVFAVGTGGTIVHAQTRGVYLPEVTLTSM